MKESSLRYSAEDLKEFDKIIAEKLDNARKELAYIKESLSRKNDPGTETTASEYRSLEDGAESAEKENLSTMAGRLQKFIQQLEFAAIRIKNGTYGICITSGQLIPKERLRAVPHTQQTIEAKMGAH
jgi:RNA polymerase-binding transcription factor DksA